MLFPSNDTDLASKVKWIIDSCMDSRGEREVMYDKRERYYLFGSASTDQVLYNRLESHLDLVAAFLYAPDHAFFHCAAARNAEDALVKQAIALQDDWNEDFNDTGVSDIFSDALEWSLVYDTMLIKQGWNDTVGEGFAELVPPHNFGVFQENITDLNSQLAFCHTYHITYDEAVARLVRAGKVTEIPRLTVTNTPFESPFPSMLTRMIINTTGGTNLMGNISGQINPEYTPAATYQPKVNTPLARFYELWAWDSEASDYRIFHMIAPDIIVTDSKKVVAALSAGGMFKPKKKVEKIEQYFKTPTNYFLPQEHPFTVVRPFTKYNYFYGKAHIDALIPLQDWMTERLDQIHDILERQAYPPRVGSGMMGLTDEKMELFGGADTYLFDQLPQAQVKELYPEMPPDIFADFKEIGTLFLEASGLTEILAGKGEQGVRGRAHAQQLKTTGGGRIKRTALKLESSLVRIGDLGIKLKMKNDDDPIIPDPLEASGKSEPFVAAQIAGDIKIKVLGHSHSPLFADDAKELAVLMRKFQAIDNEMFVRLLNPPGRDNIIHSQRAQKKKAAAAIAANPELAMLQAGGKKGKKI